MPVFDVSINNKRYTFSNSDKDSILHSGLISGLNLKYGCDSGNCGDCIAQLKTGKIQQISRSDYVMDRHQNNNNSFLMCCHAPLSDIEISAIEHGSEDEIEGQIIDAKIHKIHQLSKNVLEIEFKTPRSQPLKFFAGQYVTVTMENGLSRNKSVASCPCDGSRPRIHVKLSKDDPYSQYVFNDLKKNDIVNIVGPKGHFTLDDDSNAPIILIAYETGMASIKSLIEHLLALEKEQPIELYHLHTPKCDHYLENYCHSLDDALDNFQYSLVCLKNDGLDHLSEVFQHIVDTNENIKQSEVYAALPSAFNQKANSILIKAGLSKSQYKIDYLKPITLNLLEQTD